MPKTLTSWRILLDGLDNDRAAQMMLDNLAGYRKNSLTRPQDISELSTALAAWRQVARTESKEPVR